MFTGGSSTGLNTGGKGSGAAGTKDALMENGMPEGYMDWTAAQWAEWQKNPENREAAVRAANAPLAAARGERTLQDREHILGAGPNEPGAPIWPVANPQGQLHYLGAGPNEPGTPAITVAPRNYMSDYQPNPALNELLNPPVGSPQYLSDNGLSWAGGGQPAGGGAVVNTTSVTDDYPGGAQAMLEDGIRIRMGQGESYDQALQETRADIARQNLLAAAGTGLRYQPYQPASQGAAVRDQSRNGEPGNQRYDARTGKGSNTFREINEGMGNAEIYSIVYNNALLSGMSPESAAVAAAEGVNHWRDYNPRDIAAKIGATIENADVYEDWLRNNTDLGSRVFTSEDERVRYEQGLGNQFENAAAAGEIEGLTSSAEIRERLDRMRDQEQARIDRLKELAEQHSESIGYEGAAQKAEAEGYLPGTQEFDQAVYQNMKESWQQAAGSGQSRNGEPGNQRYVYRPEAAGSGQSAEGSTQSGGRPGVDAEIMSWGGEPAAAGSGQRTPDSVRFAEEQAARRNEFFAGRSLQGAGAGNGAGTGNGTGAGAGTGSGAGAGTGSGKDSGKGTGGKGTDIPEGSKIYEPSYKGNQGSKVVKAPYKKDGYTEEEIHKMGNVPYLKRNGDYLYEGYYKWNNKYYPIDQEKANYYKYNGNSYKGWEEGMRDYFNNFGTFYGYRSDWRKAGRAVPNYSGGRGGGGGGGRGYSYGGGSSYGNGSTANNGLYWNPNTSWSI